MPIGRRRSGLRAVPRLIPMVADRDTSLASSAYWSLKKISGKSFPRDPARWTVWWNLEGSRELEKSEKESKDEKVEKDEKPSDR